MVSGLLLSAELLLLLFRGGVNSLPFSFCSLLIFGASIAAAFATGVHDCIRQEVGLFSGVLFSIILWCIAQSALGLSIEVSDTLLSINRVAVPLSAFITAIMLSAERKQARWLLTGAAAIGFGVAVLGLAQFWLAPDMLLAAQKRYYLGNLTAVFVNRNTAATFLGIETLLLTTLWFDARFSGSTLNVEARMAARRSMRLSDVVYGCAVLVCLIALLLTGSRAGLVLSCASFLFLVVALSFRVLMKGPRELRSRRLREGAVGVVVLAAALIAVSGRAALRFQVNDLSEGRGCTYISTVHGIKSTFPGGVGFGNFQWAFPQYRMLECGIDGIWDRGHNFYLEGLLTLGLPFVFLFAAFIGVIVVSVVRGLRSRGLANKLGYLGASCAGLILCHSAVDFSLQIPGMNVFVAIIFGAIIGVIKSATMLGSIRVGAR